jgi:acetyl esterase
MKKNLIFYSFGILLLAIIFFIFIKDPHIRWQHKILHYASEALGKLSGVGGSFNREIFSIFISKFFAPSKYHTGGKYINDVLIEEITVLSRWKLDPAENKQFKIHMYVPKTYSKKLPVMINIHGGGFVHEYNDGKSFEFAKEGMIVISVWYRLAPEHKYPTALEDCYSTLVWLNETNNDLVMKYADLDKIVVMGDSAGGNLAALLPFIVKERNYPRNISHQILIYPTMASKNETESNIKYRESGYLINTILIEWFLDQYLPHEHLLENPLVNPSKNTNFSSIPPALIILARFDPLYSEGKHYAELLKSHKINVQVEEYDSIHGFCAVSGTSEEIDAYNKIVTYLKNNKFLM